MRSGGGGGAGGGGRSSGGASSTGTKAAVAGTIGGGGAGGGTGSGAASGATAAAAAAKAAAGATAAKAPARLTAAAKATVATVAAKPKGVMGAIESVASKSPSGSLLLSESVRAAAGAVKSAADFGKQDAFDREALSLARDGKAVLHYHDAPNRLSQSELAGMVFEPSPDGQRAHGATGTWFIGMAKRRGT